MRWQRRFTWLVLSMLLLAVCCWHPNQPRKGKGTERSEVRGQKSEVRDHGPKRNTHHAPRNTSPLTPHTSRLTNTPKTLSQLIRSDHALLLENALLDTTDPSQIPNLKSHIPESLRAPSDPGAYIVQSRRPPDSAFRSTLRQAGALIISYIPNNAYLVRASPAAAQQLVANPQVQAILPYEPYLKLKPALLELALAADQDVQSSEFKVQRSKFDPAPDPSPLSLSLLLFSDTRSETLAALPTLGVELLGEDHSPFGPVLKIRSSSARLSALARLAGVQEIELARARVPADDLSRATIGVAADTTTPDNYLGLTGTNVLINVNDTGIDANHPDLFGRVLLASPLSGFDTNGHGTHVAGIIAGSGLMSTNLTNAPGSVNPAADFQFRGVAPRSSLFSLLSSQSDAYLQETAARTNALISANGWTYDSNEYDLAAASYDAAVRDALPAVPGSQPMLYVFPAGNRGRGNDDGTGGVSDGILSPATAKNVITVGALEQARFITNEVWQCVPDVDTNNPPNCQTNQPWLGVTDTNNQVAGFSSRGNVGIGLEGPFGRFKPDVLAPGAFVISARSAQWDQAAYYHATNDLTNFSEVLSNLNEALGPFYRFESGTSMAAADVAGTLALMQEFFTQRLGRTNRPALMKALLINGARSPAPGHAPQVSGSTNFQGWGLIHLPNSAPASLTNLDAATNSMLAFDQGPANSLATGQSHTRSLTIADAARTLPLRFTLVWTDPPGNPLASLKLVNDLNLIVTNLDTGEIFFGNDILSTNLFNLPWDTNSSPNSDVVNNVENVFLSPPLGTNYSVTVLGHRVNVNAVTAQTNDVAQDYALVISSGDGEVPDAIALTDSSIASSALPLVTVLTNSLIASPSGFGSILFHQRVGSNHPLLDTPTVPLPGSTNALITVGSPSQWHFYVLTNDTPFTNAAFVTFFPHPLALPVGSTNLSDFGLWTLDFGPPDLDLYVSTNPALLSLDLSVVSNAWSSVGRGGAETVILSNAPPAVYYIGVKCETQEAAEYAFLGLFSELPFSQTDTQGNQLLRGFPVPTPIPSGSPLVPGQALIFCVAPEPIPIHRVIVTNTLTHPFMTDLVGSLTHGGASAVLNNHSTNTAVVAQPFIYDDSLQGDIPGAQPTGGPGSLRDFTGQSSSGQWLLAMASTNQPGTNDGLSIFLEPQPQLTNGIVSAILPGACREDFVSVSPATTNLTVTASLNSGSGPVLVEVCPVGATGNDCQSLVLNVSVTNVAVLTDKSSNPPLNPGSYLVRVCNQGPDAASIATQAILQRDPFGAGRTRFSSSAPMLIPDDAVSVSSLRVSNNNPIVSVAVGVRIDHPRISDLVLRLISPNGTGVLLQENRGGNSPGGMGVELVITNIVPVSSTGGPEASTNVMDLGVTSGTVTIDYDMYSLPDDMRVYYEGQLLFDSGLISGGGATNLSFGPGSSTLLTIVMNQGGSTNTSTAWDYTVTSIGSLRIYSTFTEDTRLALVPIKFAAPPFTNLTLSSASSAPTHGIFYLPEASLDKFVGQSALGDWKLEIRDTRAGAVDPSPMLLSWQLSFLFKDLLPLPLPVSFGTAVTNTAPPGRIQYLAVDAPAWARFATNRLITAGAPVNLLFNQSLLPTGSNSVPPDFILFSGSTNDAAALAATNGAPSFLPGARYYLGIQNTNATNVSFALAVDFDIISLASGVPASTSLAPGSLPRYFSFDVHSNATSVAFQLLNLTGNADLVARKGLPLPDRATFDYTSLFPGTNSEQILLFTNSSPVPLSPGRWYLGVYNADPTNVSATVLATEFTNVVPPIITLTSGIPYANTNSGTGNAADYYRFTVSTNARRAQFEINHPTADLTLVARKGLPLPSLSSYDVLSANSYTNDELIVLYNNSGPVLLSPGDWFLSAVNVSGGPSAYSILATEFTASGTPILITSSHIYTNSFCLTWTSLPGIHYCVQAKSDFTTSTNWPTLSPTITASDSTATWCLPLPSFYHYFRVREGLALSTNLPPPLPVRITRISSSTNGVLLQWTASTNSQFDVQWTPSFTPPSWNAFTNTLTSTNGSFQFLDDGSQSTGLGPERYYRLRQWP